MGLEVKGKEDGGRGMVLWTGDDVGGDGGRGDKDGTGEMDSSGECVSDGVTETGELEGVPWRIDGCSGSSRNLYDGEGVAGDKAKGLASADLLWPRYWTGAEGLAQLVAGYGQGGGRQGHDDGVGCGNMGRSGGDFTSREVDD
ncbi:hypothetical protein LIER_11548 [Lithospermum erythrorhizon]|uniref:Uncharacterized protein n=1 Tax=Lithospermum erythrorhizon TaxID=34254 RepID=A0AAV3PTK6_LITER